MSASPEYPATAQHYWAVRGQRVRVPYIAPWSVESLPPRPLVRHHGREGVRLGYADELPAADRRMEALWVRVPLGRGEGTPNLAGVHPLRQRQCMTFLLCQVCGGPTVGSRRDERHLFVMRAANGLAEGARTHLPPVHEACAVEAVRDCPHLRKGYCAALVKHTPAWGIAGVEYDPGTLQALAPAAGEELAYVAYDDEPRIRWVLAAREVISLHGVTTVDINSLNNLGVAR